METVPLVDTPTVSLVLLIHFKTLIQFGLRSNSHKITRYHQTPESVNERVEIRIHQIQAIIPPQPSKQSSRPQTRTFQDV